MKKSICLFILILAFLSCKKNEKTDPQPEVSPALTGKLYGVPFTVKVALDRYTNFSMPNYKPEDLFCIYLSADAAKSCASANKEFTVRLSVPRKVGTFSQNDTYILVNDPRDPTGQDGVLFSSATSTITITSVTADKIIGQVDIKRPENDIEIKGRFEAAVCR